MKILEGLYYTRDHEWVRLEGNRAYIGITDFAQLGLGDVVYAELPEAGSELKAGDAFGVVESVKAASDVYTPVSGQVADVNGVVADTPEILNSDPYGSWMICVELSNPSELDGLMGPEAYNDWCLQEG